MNMCIQIVCTTRLRNKLDMGGVDHGVDRGSDRSMDRKTRSVDRRTGKWG